MLEESGGWAAAAVSRGAGGRAGILPPTPLPRERQDPCSSHHHSPIPTLPCFGRRRAAPSHTQPVWQVWDKMHMDWAPRFISTPVGAGWKGHYAFLEAWLVMETVFPCTSSLCQALCQAPECPVTHVFLAVIPLDSRDGRQGLWGSKR